MLQKVREIWLKGVLEQSLYNVARLELGLTTRPTAVEDAWQVLVQRPNQPQRRLLPGTRISAAFDEFGKALLVLGAPGAGKTTLLLELTKDLIDRAEKDTNHVLPVVFNLSSWAVRQPLLSDWLIDELSERYQVPHKHARSWVAKDLILPLLDGLDEVAPECRSACAEAINVFRKEHGLIPMAVCSRVTDYEALTTKLHLPGALVVQSLTREQTNCYLAQAGTPLEGLRTALQNDEVLWELLDTPLMLSITVLAYRGRSAAEVQTTGTLEERRTQLFAAYTDAMFNRRGKVLLYSHQQTIQWLAWLASAMVRHNQSEFYMEWMQPSWLSSKWQQSMVNPVVIIFTGLLYGLLSGLFLGLVVGFGDGRLDNGLKVGAGAGLVGLASGLLMGFGNVLWTDKLGIRPVETVQWVWFKAKKRWLSRLLVGVKLGGLFAVVLLVLLLLLAKVTGLFGQSDIEWLKFVRGLLVVGLLGGLIGGLVNVLSGALVLSDIETREIPNQGIRRSLRNALLLGSSIMLFIVLVIGLLIGLMTQLNVKLYGIPVSVKQPNETLFFVLLAGLGLVTFCGPFVALFIGLKNGGIACFQHVTLRFLLWHNGFAPLRYIRFLDYAAERIFLHKGGGRYMFIHRMLLEYFAALYCSNTKTKYW